MFSKGGKKSYYNRSWRSYSRKYPFYKRSGVVGRSLAAAKSFKSSTKNQYFNCTVNGFCNFNVNSGEFLSDIVAFHPYRGLMTMTGSGSSATYQIDDSTNTRPHGAAVLDRTFRLMCCQYDEHKLTSMKVKLQPTVTIPNNWSLKLCSVVDRNFSGTEYFGSDMNDIDTLTSKDILSNAGAVVQTFNANRIYPLFRAVYPNDQKEKINFIDSTIAYSKAAGQSPLSSMLNVAWSNGASDFSPCIFFTVQSSLAPSADATITFSYSVEYNFVFRNPKNTIDRFLTLEQRGYVNGAAKNASEYEKVVKEYKPLNEVVEAVEPKG